ncbi:hypothetical protein F183_A51240 [Bryobacterales bacterium F-183]|nr:hypothetical protein F183_A51240 [Bryobacterales bacterium F-183]
MVHGTVPLPVTGTVPVTEWPQVAACQPLRDRHDQDARTEKCHTTAKSMSDQATLWNGPSGQTWAEIQPMLDRLFAPFVDLICDAVPAHTAHNILDIGCGAGAIALALAARHPKAQVTGLDISEPLVATARQRAQALPNVNFELGDAQRHPLPPATFDTIVSRFGVMFFDDPVEAFANIHKAATPEAKLTAIAWRDPSENPFMTAAERAAGSLVPELPARRPNGPGQFGFANQDYIHSVLTQSHWHDIRITPIDVPCQLPTEDLELYYTRMGALAQILPTLENRSEVLKALDQGFQQFVQADGNAHFTAACWMIQATA